MALIDLDATDLALVDHRLACRRTMKAPLVGDVVRFADDTVRRISYIWPDGSVQTSRGGSYHLAASGDCSFSGSLFTSVPGDSLLDTGRADLVSMWIFHHDLGGAGRGVDFLAPVTMWKCSRPAPAC